MDREAAEYITRARMADLCARAGRASRGRTHHNFHQYDDTYQRMLNVIQPGSFIRPHCHRAPGKSESFIVLRGEIGFFRFEEAGALIEARRLGPGRDALGVDLMPGVWHCFLALLPDTVVFEGKNGPYDPATDKQFAPWAPEEGSAQAQAYIQDLLALLPPER